MTPPTSISKPTPRRTATRLVFAYWLPAALFVALIFMVSGKANLQPPVRFPFVDKVAHVCEYGALGLLLARALRATAPGAKPGTRAALAIAAGVAVGATDEWFQSFVPGRESSLADVVADAAGVALAQVAPRGLLPE